MRIGIDGLPLTESLAGIGHYTFELSQHLAQTEEDEVDVISPKPFQHSVISRSTNTPFRLTQVKSGVLSRYWWTIGLPRHLRKTAVDIFHGTNFEIPLQNVCPSVLTIHDLSLLLFPKTHERRRVWRARLRLPLMVRRATMIITDSDSVKNEIELYLKVPETKIVRVYLASRKVFQPMSAEQTKDIRERLAVRENFLLCAGTLEPRKNLQMLIQAFEEVTRAGAQPLQLVLAGQRGWLFSDLEKHLRTSAASANVLMTGHISDEELCALYSSCKAFIYPSIYEGFGLPPLEAMACGAPVIASRIPSVTEVLGSAALLVPPTSPLELTQALRELLKNEALRQELSAAGRKRATLFSWAATAAQTREVYQEAINRYERSKD